MDLSQRDLYLNNVRYSNDSSQRYRHKYSIIKVSCLLDSAIIYAHVKGQEQYHVSVWQDA